MGKAKAIVGFVGVVAIAIMWRQYSPSSWSAVWRAVGSIFSSLAGM